MAQQERRRIEFLEDRPWEAGDLLLALGPGLPYTTSGAKRARGGTESVSERGSWISLSLALSLSLSLSHARALSLHTDRVDAGGPPLQHSVHGDDLLPLLPGAYPVRTGARWPWLAVPYRKRRRRRARHRDQVHRVEHVER